jgi:hypothetical protein
MHHAEESDPMAWGWSASEEERDSWAAWMAAAARQRREDPEGMYARWRRDATTEGALRYLDDLEQRVRRAMGR